MNVSHLTLLSRRSFSALITCSLVGSLACAPVHAAYASDEVDTPDQVVEEVIQDDAVVQDADDGQEEEASAAIDAEESIDAETDSALSGSEDAVVVPEGESNEGESADAETIESSVSENAQLEENQHGEADKIDKNRALTKGEASKGEKKAQSIEAGKSNQAIEAENGTWYVDASDDKTLTIVGFQANSSLSNLTIPSVLKAGEETYSVSTVRLLSGGNSSFSASQVTISAGLSVTDLAALTSAGTTSLVLEDGVYYSAATFRGLSKGQPNTYLSSLTIGNGVQFAPSATFQFNTNLSSLYIGSGVAFQPSQFQGCTALTSVNLNGSATTESIFNGCTNLTSVSGVNGAVANSAFKSCGLTEFDFSEVSESIGASAFDSCKSLSINDLVLNNVAVGKSAFSNVVKLTKLIMSGGSIGEKAFTKCTGLSTVIADVASIENQAFYNCKSITSLTIGQNVQYIGEKAFQTAFSSNPTITFDDSQNQRYSWNESHTAILDDYGLQVCPYDETDANISSIREITRLNSSYTGSNAYKNNYDRDAFTLIVGKCVESINSTIFSVDNVFEFFDVAEGNKFYKVQDGALYSLDGTHLVKAPTSSTEFVVPEGVLYLDANAFAGCVNLEKVTLPSTLLEIDRLVFHNCEKLTSIELPDSVEDIGVRAFTGTSLTTFKASESLWTKRGYSSFTQDGSVPNVNWLFNNGDQNGGTMDPSGYYAWKDGSPFYRTLTTLDLSSYQASYIPYYAFSGLPGITEVQIPSTVTRIGSGAFYYCDNLSTVYCYAPDSMVIDMAGTGHGDSGSGDANESYVINAPGAFSYWNEDKEASSDGTGMKFEDRTGITFYGSAYNEELRVWCGDYGQNFIPIVTLQTLSGSDNPFWNKTLSSQYAIDYGEGMIDYGYVEIADIAKGGTPQVVAKFGQYSGTRDLTDDAACTIVYYGPDGSRVTSFDEEGEYTASLVGDGKSVFGSRQIKFFVGERPQEQTEPADEADGSAGEADESSAAKTDESGAAKADGETKASEGAPAATPAATRASGVVYQTVYASGAAVQSVTQAATNVYAVDDKAGIAFALERIAGTDSSILVWGGGTEAAPQYVWEVPGTGITADSASGLAFGVSDVSKNSKLANLTDGADFMAFKVAQDGSFPGTYAMHWKTSSTFYDGAKVNVYRVVDADGANPTLKLLKANVPVVDGYVTVDVDAGGTYMLMEAIEDAANPLAEKAYADTGIDADAVGSAEQSPMNWAAPIALTAVVAAAIGTFGGWFMRFRRRDEGGADATTGQKL